MTFHDFIYFLLPEFDVIQLIFGGTMLFLVVLSISLLFIQANSKTWEKKWHDYIVTDDAGNIDSEQSSVSEISSAVASPAEKMIDVMPGILLIIGLLGTFLGLGIALNKASDILIDANSSGMDDAMSNLMGMMEGLGTKFKTSTWGIISFLLLKSWSAVRGDEGKRLRWCVNKINAALNQVKQKAKQEKEAVQNLFLNALTRLDDSFIREGDATRNTLNLVHSGVESLFDNVIKQNTLNNKELCENIAQEAQLIRDTLGKLHSDTGALISSAMKKSADTMQKLHSDISRESHATRDTLNTLYTNTEAVLNAGMEQSDTHNRKLIKQLSAVTNVMTAMLKGQQSFNSQLVDNSHLQLNEQKETRESLQHFISINNANLETIKVSAETMSESAHGMGESALELQNAIGMFRETITSVLGGIKTDLGSTIEMMGDSFSQNMTQISGSMSDATEGISMAVTSLSQNVGVTMSEVKDSIEQSIKAQRNAQHEFISTSETLNEKVISMTKLVDDLREQILSGLSAISSSNRQVASLNNRYDAASSQNERSAQAIEDMVTRLQSLHTDNPLEPVLMKIHSGMNDLIRHIQSVEQAVLDNKEQDVILNTLDARFLENINELQAIRNFLSTPKESAVPVEIKNLLSTLNGSLERVNTTLSQCDTIHQNHGAHG